MATSRATSARRSSRCRRRSTSSGRSRTCRTKPEVVVLAATDPANPYGTILRWPDARSGDDRGASPTRSAGSLVVIVNGALAAYISRGARQLLAFLPEDEPARSTTARALAATLARLGLLVHEDQRPPGLRASAVAVPRSKRVSVPRRWASRFGTAGSDEGRSSVPEGDTIHRAAATLHRALAGHAIVRFESVFPALTRVHDDHPLTAMSVERVQSSGKHLLMHFSGGLVLRTHMRMHGSWHIYRPGERWRQNRRDMRVLVATADFEAVGFNIPVAEFIKVDPKHALTRHRVAGKTRTRRARRRLRSRRSDPAPALAAGVAHRRRAPQPATARRARQRLQVGSAVRVRDQPVRARRRARRRAARAARRHRPEAVAGQRRRRRQRA